MSARRKKGLTEADRALWRAYAATIKVLPGRDLPPAPPAPVSVEPPAATPARAAAPPAPRPALPPPELLVGRQPAGLDTKRWTALRRGRIRPERTLDLHGRRAQDAHAVLRRFIADAYADGVRCIEVVTGKGSTPEGGILRRELPHWLNAPEIQRTLLGAAHPHAANTGAVHLLLRRRK